MAETGKGLVLENTARRDALIATKKSGLKSINSKLMLLLSPIKKQST
mgnify:CR=1 FL=1